MFLKWYLWHRQHESRLMCLNDMQYILDKLRASNKLDFEQIDISSRTTRIYHQRQSNGEYDVLVVSFEDKSIVSIGLRMTVGFELHGQSPISRAYDGIDESNRDIVVADILKEYDEVHS